ncbi:hypothetical protein M413DRAFT_22743 [Hebeloma cylindrosporum]|uniref:Uncharacterized protein n=1 Tax=Hebeloma cylindrosporum TaxID=76867 RepID=A0A0C3CVQ2_HEBCY|nr:hypothetical protein M413DRAFT_22743 [Hebeloma cylindrosporum h7]
MSQPHESRYIPRPSLSPQLYRSLSQDAYLQSETDLSGKDSLDEGELTEEQLRVLYEDEEIERFLTLFSAFVREVQVPDNLKMKDPGGEATESSLEEGDWTPIHPKEENLPLPINPFPSSNYRSVSEELAYRYLVPILPQPRPSAPPFTLGRLRIATERLYIAILPVYGPFLSQLKDLATWEDNGASLIYCSMFWILWWYNLLAPAFLLRMLVCLVRRRLFPYPSLADLRQHRQEIIHADAFGQQVSARFSASSSGVKETWHLFKLLDRTWRSRAKASTKEKGKGKELSDEIPSDTAQEQGPAVHGDADDGDAQDLKRISLQVMEDIADIHERICNIFIWRRPASSQRYAIILFILFLTTLLLPTKYIIKLSVFVLGFVFWHVVPVVVALAPSERRRVPLPFRDVPTDAEYAMELISQRGKKQESPDHLGMSSSAQKLQDTFSQENGSSIDWKKWGDRVAIGKTAVTDIKRLRPGNPGSVNESWPPRHPVVPGAINITQTRANAEIHTYPCQHPSGPGLITLTHNAFFFTPLMSQTAKISLSLAAVKGVKKIGFLKGLSLRWSETLDEIKELKEEKFLWIGGRDELFARLVGTDGRRWIKV